MVARYIGGSAAARLIGVARSTVLDWHGKHLHPKKNDSGNWVYSRDEVVEFAKWYQKSRPRFQHMLVNEDEKAAKAFQLFEAGFTVIQVVIQVRMNPKTIEEWYATWQRDTHNLPVGLEGKVELEVKKTTLEIKREELAIKRAARKELERKQTRRMEREADHDRARDAKENALPETPTRESTPLHEVFEHAVGGKK